MKRCPTCNRSYIDEAQRFCLDDGATLVETPSSSFDPQATLAIPGGMSTSPHSNPYGSGSGAGSPGSGAGQSSSGSGAGQSGYGAGSGQNQQAGSWAPTPQRFTPAQTSAPKRSMLPWILGGAAVVVIGLVGLIVVLALAFSGTSNKNNNSNSASSNSNSATSNSRSSLPSDVVIRSSDGKIQVSAPPTWKSTTDLNDKAELQVSDVSNQVYLIVLTDNKADYTDMDLDRHSSGTLDSLTNSMTNSNRVGPTKLTIDGSPAVQYEVRGEIKNLNVVYLHTTVESANRYHQIVSWTLQSRYDSTEDLLKRVTTSFKEN